MNPKHVVTPLDKDALVLLPGLRYAKALIEVAMQVSRHTALQAQVEPPPKTSPSTLKKNQRKPPRRRNLRRRARLTQAPAPAPLPASQ
jgi:hypothetical protein